MLNLNDRLKLLYKFLYTNETENFVPFNINISKIKMDDIKIQQSFWKENDIEIKTKALSEIENAQFQLIQIIEDENIIVLKRMSNNFNSLVFISPYKNKNDIDNITSNYDNYFSYILSQLVIEKKTFFIMLPAINYDFNISDIKDLIKNYKLYVKYKDDIQNEKIVNLFSVSVKPATLTNYTLSEYIKNENFNYKAFLFQIIHGLAIIQQNFPNFVHNRLKVQNMYIFLINNISNNDGKTYIYNKKKFYINDNFFQLKISNFKNSKFLDSNVNRYYDLYYFLYDLYQYNKFNNADSSTKLFLNSIFPEKLRKRLIPYDKLSEDFIPYKLLDSTYFNSYITTNINITLSPDIKFKNYENLNKKKYLKKSNKNMNKNVEMFSRKLRKEKINQTGGNRVASQPYKREINMPVSNDQENVYHRRKMEEPKVQPPIIAEQRVYDTSVVKKEKHNPPLEIPAYGYNNLYYNFPLPYQNNINNNIPIQKTYNLTLANPIEHHTTINRIYEDMLPGNPFPLNSTSTYDRIELAKYIRNQILVDNDGEIMTVTPSREKTLLSYIRLISINPYFISRNPYHELSQGFLLYQGAYPVRFDKKRAQINIAKDSTCINLRMYELSIAAAKCLKINNNMDMDSFDVWRDIKYYETVREDIVKAKISPNFVIMYLYIFDNISRFDYKTAAKYKNRPLELLKRENNNKKKLDNTSNLLKDLVYTNNDIEIKKVIDKQIETSNESIVALTESPTTNIIQWAHPTWENNGTVQTQVTTGYHDIKVWKSVLFQLVYACAVLQEKEILFHNFSLENNVFIKDLFNNSKSTSYWIYRVDNIDFYIPNYGYLLLIDSKYVDIYDDIYKNNIDNSNKKIWKIESYKIYDSKNNTPQSDIKGKILSQFKDIVSPDNFTRKFKKQGALSPPDDILKLLETIYNSDKNDIKDYLQEFFQDFLNNRIGTAVTVGEKEVMDLTTRRLTLNFKKGEMCAYYDNETHHYIWGIFVNKVGTNYNIITKNIFNNKYHMTSDVVLYKKPESVTIKQNTSGINFSSDNCIETYNLR